MVKMWRNYLCSSSQRWNFEQRVQDRSISREARSLKRSPMA